MKSRKYTDEQDAAKLTTEQQELVMDNIAFAWQQAHKFSKSMKNERPWLDSVELAEDLASAAVSGLVKAAQRFDSNRPHEFDDTPVKFLTYAGWYVLQAIQEQTRHWHPISPSFVQVRASWDRKRKTQSRECVVRINKALDLDSDEADVLTDIPDSSVAHYSSDFVSMMECVPRRHRQVLRAHFQDNLSYSEIGSKLGVSRQRVMQIVSSAIDKIRENMKKRKTELEHAEG